MIKTRFKAVLFAWVVVMVISCVPLATRDEMLTTELTQFDKSADFNQPRVKGLDVSSISNLDLIQEALSTKYNNFTELNYLPQEYEISLQATYYGLHVLKDMGRLYLLEQEKIDAIVSYITSCYNESTNQFEDKYSDRYLRENRSYLSSLLEVNCYAILSLEMLDRLNLIDEQEAIDFIWSCYNPDTSGFIGRPYDPDLPDEYELATMDNIYYAILTLDMLLEDWTGYPTEKQELIDFIASLQSTDPSPGKFGGFGNDLNGAIDTLGMPEPNLLSSYYCVRSLEIFGEVSSIAINDFQSFLDYLYDYDNSYFLMYEETDNRLFCNIVAAPMGFELARITGYTAIFPDARLDVMNFLMDNRNSWGIWNQSTNIGCCELIDAFQTVRSMKRTGLHSFFDGNKIASAMELFYNDGGYSLVASAYSSQALVHSFVSSMKFMEWDEVLNTIKNDLYKIVISSLIHKEFAPFIQVDDDLLMFRSEPIKYELNTSHEYTFIALDSVKKLGKLSEFDSSFDLSTFISDIANSQFIEEGFNNSGAFMPNIALNNEAISAEIRNQYYFDYKYSYYAVKSLELIYDYDALLGNLKSEPSIIDRNDLRDFTLKNIVNTTSTLYLDSPRSDDNETALENTYYTISVLKAIGKYEFTESDEEKIENFVVQSVNYTNLKNFYYCYKIKEILDLTIDFDAIKVQALVRSAYSENERDFYSTPDAKIRDSEALEWICEIARDKTVCLEESYPSVVTLGDIISMDVYISHLVINDFGSNINVILESEQLGTITFENMSNSHFYKQFSIADKESNFPTVEGTIYAYNDTDIIAEKAICFQTLKKSTDTTNPSENQVPSESESGEKTENDPEKSNNDSNENIDLESDSNIKTILPVLFTSLGIPSAIMIGTTVYRQKLKLKVK